MDNFRQNPTTQIVCGIRELVKGQEQRFLEELVPLVHRLSVRLDLSLIARIDAAGLAALISLYREASKAGHVFAVINPSRRVARILEIVGLDRILMEQEPAMMLPPRLRLDQVAA